MSTYSPVNLSENNRIAPTLKVWWIPQVPMKAFEILVDSFAVAKALLETLPMYDLFQLEQNVKPDFYNTGGLCIWDESLDADERGDKWTDWENEDCDSIREVSMEECYELDRHFYNATLEKAAKR